MNNNNKNSFNKSPINKTNFDFQVKVFQFVEQNWGKILVINVNIFQFFGRNCSEIEGQAKICQFLCKKIIALPMNYCSNQSQQSNQSMNNNNSNSQNWAEHTTAPAMPN